MTQTAEYVSRRVKSSGLYDSPSCCLAVSMRVECSELFGQIAFALEGDLPPDCLIRALPHHGDVDRPTLFPHLTYALDDHTHMSLHIPTCSTSFALRLPSLQFPWRWRFGECFTPYFLTIVQILPCSYVYFLTTTVSRVCSEFSAHLDYSRFSRCRCHIRELPSVGIDSRFAATFGAVLDGCGLNELRGKNAQPSTT